MEHHDRSPESPRPSRRQFLLTIGSTVAAGVASNNRSLINEFINATGKKATKMKGAKPSIVFCDGIWADGSCFNKVIPALQAEGHQCIAAQCSLNTTADERYHRGSEETVTSPRRRVLREEARLLDLTTDAILVRNAEDRITFWNRGASEMYGFTGENDGSQT